MERPTTPLVLEGKLLGGWGGAQKGKALCACDFFFFLNKFLKTYGLENLKISKETLQIFFSHPVL